MRPEAEIDKISQPVAGKLFAGLLLDQLHLEMLPLPGEVFDGFFFRNDGRLEAEILSNQFFHPGFDLLQILFGKTIGAFKIVIETVTDCRTNSQVDARKQAVYGRCHEVRRTMAIDFQRGARYPLSPQLFHPRILFSATYSKNQLPSTESNGQEKKSFLIINQHAGQEKQFGSDVQHSLDSFIHRGALVLMRPKLFGRRERI